MPDERFATIAGRWRTSGRVLGDPATTVTGSDVYEVLLGGHFLVHHVDVTMGGKRVQVIEIIGEPDGRGGYLARSYDSEVNAEVMRVAIDDQGVFRFRGDAERTRATLTVAPDGASMHATWDRSDDGATWRPWMDISFTRE